MRLLIDLDNNMISGEASAKDIPAQFCFLITTLNNELNWGKNDVIGKN